MMQGGLFQWGIEAFDLAIDLGISKLGRWCSMPYPLYTQSNAWHHNVNLSAAVARYVSGDNAPCSITSV